MARGRSAFVPPRALTCDAWYTLLYLTPARRRALNRARRRIWTAALARRGFGHNDSARLLARLDDWKARTEARGSTPPLRDQVAWISHQAGGEVPPDRVVGPLNRAVLRAGVRASPGAARALRTLSDGGVPLGIVSNVLNETGAAARSLLDLVGLLPLFSTVVLSCEHPYAKPRPEPFRLAARFLGVSPRELVHVGDLAYDVHGARRAGARAVLFTEYSRWNRYLPGWRDHGVRRSAVRLARWPGLPDLWRRLGTARG